MKKLTVASLVLMILMLALGATGCGGGGDEAAPSEPSPTPSEPAETPVPTLEPTPSPTSPPSEALDNWGALGDVNLDGVVDAADLDMIAQLLDTGGGDPNWNAELDLDRNRKIDVVDLAIAGRGYGSTHAFHQARQIANSDRAVYRLDACIDGQDRVHVIWSDSSNRNVYYTRLDRYGNTLIDDVLLDSGPSTGTDVVAIGCDESGDAHMVWDCISDVCQARFDPWGYQVLEKAVFDDRWVGAGPEAAVDLDAEGNAHVLYRMGTTNRMVYAMLTDEGEKAISIEEPLIYDAKVSRYRQLAVDGEGNAHLVWSEEDGEDRLYYAKMGADASASIAPMVIGQTHWDGGVNASHRPSLALDSEGNALVLWNRSNPSQLLLDKIAPDGTVLLDDYPIFPEYKASFHQDIAVDGNDQLHLWAPTGWAGTLYLNAYGIFDEAAQPVEPMHWAMEAGNRTIPNYSPIPTGMRICSTS